MGFRFYRRVTILPVISINFGKMEASVSVGPQGANGMEGVGYAMQVILLINRHFDIMTFAYSDIRQKVLHIVSERYVRNLFEQAIQRQAVRLSTVAPLTVEMLTELTLNDLDFTYEN